LFVALVGVPGDGGTGTFLHGGAGDAAFKGVRVAASQFNLAALDLADLAQYGGLGCNVLFFSDRSVFQLDLKIEQLLLGRSIVRPLVSSRLERGTHDEIPAGEGREKQIVD